MISNEPKLKIISIGRVSDEGNLEGNWRFSGEGIPNSVGISLCDKSGEVKHGGYTVDELREIAKTGDV